MTVLMSNRTSLFAWISLLFFVSCQQAPKGDASIGIAKPYFDLKAYFNSEVTRLHGKGKAKKMVSVANEQEEKLIDSIDFLRELTVFADADINRPAWSDSYLVDSSFNEQKELVRLSYKAIDNKLKTQGIEVDFERNSVSRILIENKVVNSITASSQTLLYQPTVGYTIESRQKVAFSDEQVFKVEVRFL
jgi:hypothetical protein